MNFSPSDRLSGEPDLLSLSGQTMSQKLKSPRIWTEGGYAWNTHISNICTKANRTLGFLRRTLFSCPQNVKEAAYKGMVRPILQYGSSVWDPPILILASAEVFSVPDEPISKLSCDAITHSLPLRSRYFKILSNQNRFI